MKKSLLLSTLLACMCSSAMAFDVVVGTGTKGDDSSPYGVGSKLSTTETIYLASEIGAKGTITDIAYLVTNGAALTNQEVHIYMGNTDKDSFSSADDNLPVYSMKEVFSGTITLGNNVGSWENIKLTSPFRYDGTKNLAVMVCRSANSFSKTLNYQCTETSGKVLSREDDDNPNYGWYMYGSSFDAYNCRANIRLTFENPALNINGDLNHDGVVSVLDLEMLANVILEKSKPEVVKVSDGQLHYGALVPATNIELDQTDLHMVVGETYQFTATVSPADASCKEVDWVSLDPSIADFEAPGLVRAKDSGRTTLQAVAKDGSGVMATCELWTTIFNLHNGHEIIYLGDDSNDHLVMWATENLGTSPEAPQGQYYAWGENVGYRPNSVVFAKANYNFCIDGKLTKYSTKLIDGVEDNLTQLELEDDAAYQAWGENEWGYWCIPSREEMEWLADDSHCRWTWDDEKKGYTVISLGTGQSIFLPAAGYSGNDYDQNTGFYWTSTLSDYFNIAAVHLGFGNEGHGSTGSIDRFNGLVIRPVFRMKR